MGHRGRAGDLRRVLRLELRLGIGGHARLSRHDGVRGADVHHLHLQLHRADHRDPARRRAVRVQPARLRPARRLPGGLRDADRVRVRAAGDRAGDRRLPQRAVPGARRPRSRRVGAYVVFMALNIVGVRIAATFELFVTLLAIFELLVFMGVVAPGFRWRNFVAGGWAGADALQQRGDPRHVRRDPVRDLVLPRDRGRGDGRRGGEGPAPLDPDRLHRRHPDAGGAGRSA